MDLVVPGEMLVQIASFLSKKDCNSLIRTSRTAYNKINLYRNMLPKTSIDVTICTQSENISFKISINLIDRWIVEVATQPHDQLIVNEADAYAKLLTFFKESTDSANKTIFRLPYFDGLSLHLKFLFDNFHVSCLKLYNVKDANFEEITKYMRENRRNVADLRIENQHLPECTLELVRVCKPKCLDIYGTELPEGFFKTPIIRNLSNLCVFTKNNKMCDRDLLSLSAVYMTFSKITDITIQGIISFISEWVEGKREVWALEITVRWTLSHDEWKAKLAELDQDLVDVDIEPDTGDYFSAKMRRRSDNLEKKFGTSRGDIYLFTR